jgi:hypothetical protein
VGLSPIDVARGIGVASVAARGALELACARALRVPAPGGAVAAVLLLVVGEHVTHAGSGLETELWVATSLVAALAFARALTSGRPGWLGPAAALLSVVRPEGLALAPVLFAAAAMVHARAWRSFARAFVLGFLVPTALIAAARFLYFGALLPNTLAAKLDPSRTAGFGAEVRSFARDYFLDAALVGALAAVGVASRVRAWAPRRWPPSARRAAAVLVATAAFHAALLLVYGRSNLLMNYERRFVFHLLPWQVLALLPLLGAASRLLRRHPRRGGRFAVGALLLMAVSTAAPRGAARADDGRRANASYASMLSGRYGAAADWLLARFGPTTHVACYPDAGLVPYRTRFAATDFGRLNDRELARVRDPRAVADRFFALRPDVLLVSQRAKGILWDDGADAIRSDPRFADYELGARFGDEDATAVLVFVRRP